MSSFFTHAIYFVKIEHLKRNEVATVIKIAGGLSATDEDGSFESANFADPSRLYYDSEIGTLFVSCRRSLKIRALNFDDESVSTLSLAADGSHVDFGDPIQYSNFPGMDIQGIDNSALFVTEGKGLYKVASSTNRFEDVVSHAVVTEYDSLANFLYQNGYSHDARIHSVCIDQSRQMLYVAVSNWLNLIIKVPMDSVSASSYQDVKKIVGSESEIWYGSTSNQYPPVAINGYVSQNNVRLSFPMHLVYDKWNDALYWCEAYPYAGDYMLGSLTIRRLSLFHGKVDFYAGVDFSSNTETYSSVGTLGGSRDGEVNTAQFSYPISLTISNDESNFGNTASAVLYVSDRYNNAVRKISIQVLTPEPSASFSPTSIPSVSLLPTRRPSRKPTTYQPTISLHPTISLPPTKAPSLYPSISVEPSFNPTLKPTKEPSKYPTRYPTRHPTEITVIYKDVSLFRSMGFGTVHVSMKHIIAALCVGIFAGALIIVLYNYKYRSDVAKKNIRRHELLFLNSSDNSDSSNTGDERETERPLNIKNESFADLIVDKAKTFLDSSIKYFRGDSKSEDIDSSVRDMISQMKYDSLNMDSSSSSASEMLNRSSQFFDEINDTTSSNSRMYGGFRQQSSDGL